MLMALDDFEFSISNRAYQKISRRINGGWSKSDRAGNKPLWQAGKKPTESISISGFYVQSYKGAGTKEDLIELVEAQDAVLMVSGDGKYFGEWVITSVSFDETLFLEDGTPLRVDFVINLEEYHE